MVASSSADVYSPFQTTMLPEEGPQSSEEGSGLHSPVFGGGGGGGGAPYNTTTTHGDSFRYQHDQLSVYNHYQPPILDLDVPSPASARHPAYPSNANTPFDVLPPRNHHHLGIDFGPPAASRGLPIQQQQQQQQPIDYRYTSSSSSERRLPGGSSSSSSHDHSYSRPSGNSSLLPMDPDHKPALVPSSAAPRQDVSSTAEASTSSREPRKEISSVVIACRQCRSRKIRCDSTRPVCNNCVRRSNECQYDLVPKRRGPDKRPGTRQRSCKKRPADGSAPPPPKRKRTTATAASSPDQSQQQSQQQQQGQQEQQRSTEQQRDLLPSSSSSRQKDTMSMQDNRRPSSPPSSRQVDRHHHQEDPYNNNNNYPPHLHQQQSHVVHHHHHHHPPPSPPQLRLPTDEQFKHELSLPLPPPPPTYRRTTSSSSSSAAAAAAAAAYIYDQGPSSSYAKSSYPHPRQLDVDALQFSSDPIAHHHRAATATSPSIEPGNNRFWWDKILADHSPNILATELTFLYNNTGPLLSFVNLNYFVHRLNHPDERLFIQPAFMYAVLALARLMKSSSIELGAQGVRAAIEYSGLAHKAFEEATRNGWGDYSLAEAALVLALFESSAYLYHSPERATNALVNLDDLINTLSLTTIDASDPDVNQFSPNMVPMVMVDSVDGAGANTATTTTTTSSTTSPSDNNQNQNQRQCKCLSSSSGSSSSSSTLTSLNEPANNPYSTRPYILPWDPHWSVEQIRAEEIRRLVWAALTLVSEYVTQCEAFNERCPRFFLCEPANFALLFPAEVLDRVSPSYRPSLPSPHSSFPSPPPLSTKESVWALYCRSMLLWNFCNSHFHLPSQEEERAEQAHEAFLEAQAIEDSLGAHRCNLDTTVIYMCREYVHNTRMLVAQALRSFHGLDNGGKPPGPGAIFKRKQAEDWLFYEDQIIRRANQLIHRLDTPEGYQLTRRPFRINWFINQLTICLLLWSIDPQLEDALKLAKAILGPIDVLNALWTCPNIQAKCDALRRQLEEACHTSRIPGPLPAAYSLPQFSQPPPFRG